MKLKNDCKKINFSKIVLQTRSLGTVFMIYFFYNIDVIIKRIRRHEINPHKYSLGSHTYPFKADAAAVYGEAKYICMKRIIKIYINKIYHLHLGKISCILLINIRAKNVNI